MREFIKNFKDVQYRKDLSNNSKTLYNLIADRISLSASNGWADMGGTFCYFSRAEMASKLNVCINSVTKYMKELRSVGLVIEVRKGQGKANKIYLASNCETRITTNGNQESQKLGANKTNDNKTLSLSSSSNPASNSQNKIVESILDNEIRMSSNAVSELSELEVTYGEEYVEAVISYCIDRNAKSFSYIRNTFHSLISKAIVTAESFKQSLESHREKRNKNKELKEQRLEQSNLEMTKKLAYSTTQKANNSNDYKKVNTRFNYMDSRDWAFDELDRLEYDYIDRKLAQWQEK